MERNIIGLEYICKLYDVKFSELADDFGISRQVVNSWIKIKRRRKITKKYIPMLAKKFKQSEKYFQKELSDLDRLEILENKIFTEEYSVEEEKEFNQDLKKFKNRAKKLISDDYYDSIQISEIEYSVLKIITNAETHKDISPCLWNNGMIEYVLNNVSDKLKTIKKE